jgi:Type ISP C-terminal specificity domain
MFLMSNKTKEGNHVYPLYSTPDPDGLGGKGAQERMPNFYPSFLKELARELGVAQCEPWGMPVGVTPEAILAYIYAILHSETYRLRYAEYLRGDFPRVPVTPGGKLFAALADLGTEMMSCHLLEAPLEGGDGTRYIGPASPKVDRVSYSGQSVWLNAPTARGGQPERTGTIGFRGVREEVWNFHIGSYRVCEKWLKDRKGCMLSASDVVHYQKIIVAISETIRVMGEIDQVIEEHGGWPGAFVTSPE